mmetsp:Transcript_41846/g.108330  ORF Transcript_41846/g.108330 Transcript_41846/m.108330 type:complete len:215 (-) Transcript_41846:50-694(-)
MRPSSPCAPPAPRKRLGKFCSFALRAQRTTSSSSGRRKPLSIRSVRISLCASALQAPSTLLLYTVFRVGGWKKKRRMYSSHTASPMNAKCVAFHLARLDLPCRSGGGGRLASAMSGRLSTLMELRAPSNEPGGGAGGAGPPSGRRSSHPPSLAPSTPPGDTPPPDRSTQCWRPPPPFSPGIRRPRAWAARAGRAHGPTTAAAAQSVGMPPRTTQ